jgi:hypothetical protein
VWIPNCSVVPDPARRCGSCFLGPSGAIRSVRIPFSEVTRDWAVDADDSREVTLDSLELPVVKGSGGRADFIASLGRRAPG